jgi:hypothetical protein
MTAACLFVLFRLCGGRGAAAQHAIAGLSVSAARVAPGSSFVVYRDVSPLLQVDDLFP